jgi:hypothetical protein
MLAQIAFAGAPTAQLWKERELVSLREGLILHVLERGA